MGTRGTWGVVIDGVTKMAYVHSDSYAEGLGLDVLRWARTISDDDRDKARALRLVSNDTPPTDADVEALAKFTNRNVGSRELHDWYVLLRETQGDPAKTLEAGAMEDGNDFAADSLFCEYGYVVDLDANVLEAYCGFQSSPHAEGRFASATSSRDGYYPIRLVASWPLGSLPTDDEFCKAVEGENE